MPGGETERIFDETYSTKYNKRIDVFLKYLTINSGVCFLVILLYALKILNDTTFGACYIFFSMMIFHVTGMIHNVMRHNDFVKSKNGESQYLQRYYPEIWKKINPDRKIFAGNEYRKYLRGKYISEHTDPVIDKIRKEHKRGYVYALPFFLIIIFMVIFFVSLL